MSNEHKSTNLNKAKTHERKHCRFSRAFLPFPRATGGRNPVVLRNEMRQDFSRNGNTLYAVWSVQSKTNRTGLKAP